MTRERLEQEYADAQSARRDRDRAWLDSRPVTAPDDRFDAGVGALRPDAGVLERMTRDGAFARVAADQLTEADFPDRQERRVFRALSAMAAEVRDPTPTLTLAWVDAHAPPVLPYVGWLVDLSPKLVGTFDDAPRDAVRIAAEWMRIRRATLLLSRAAAAAEEHFIPLDKTLAELEAGLAALRAGAGEGRVFDDKRVMAQAAMAYLEGDGRDGLPYGFLPLDRAVLPLLPGQLALLGGASGGGKSTVGRNIIRQWVKRYGCKVGVQTCEMTGEEQLTALACMDADVSLEGYYRRTLTDDERRRFRVALEWWRDSDLLLVDEMGNLTPEAMFRRFRRWREQGVTVFVLDHLHRLNYGAKSSGDDLRVPVAACARDLKSFCKDHEAIVLALVQYTKMRPHDEPSDEKIREANNILEEADVVHHAYRPLVAHERRRDGVLVPLTRETGLRYFDGDSDVPKGATLAADDEHVYLKLGKQRRRTSSGLVRVPFNHATGAMYTETIHIEERAA